MLIFPSLCSVLPWAEKHVKYTVKKIIFQMEKTFMPKLDGVEK
jgi:hypothetical protein